MFAGFFRVKKHYVNKANAQKNDINLNLFISTTKHFT